MAALCLKPVKGMLTTPMRPVKGMLTTPMRPVKGMLATPMRPTNLRLIVWIFIADLMFGIMGLKFDITKFFDFTPVAEKLQGHDITKFFDFRPSITPIAEELKGKELSGEDLNVNNYCGVKVNFNSKDRRNVTSKVKKGIIAEIQQFLHGTRSPDFLFQPVCEGEIMVLQGFDRDSVNLAALSKDLNENLDSWDGIKSVIIRGIESRVDLTKGDPEATILADFNTIGTQLRKIPSLESVKFENVHETMSDTVIGGILTATSRNTLNSLNQVTQNQVTALSVDHKYLQQSKVSALQQKANELKASFFGLP